MARSSKILLALTATLVLLGGAAHAETVKSVYDGDTFTLTTGEKVRLACVDAPEMRNTAKKRADKPAALRSRDFLRKLISGVDLTVERLGTDLYGRTIAKVYTPDGKDVSREMFLSNNAVIFKGYDKPCPWANH